jgi:hypothetical protein
LHKVGLEKKQGFRCRTRAGETLHCRTVSARATESKKIARVGRGGSKESFWSGAGNGEKNLGAKIAAGFFKHLVGPNDWKIRPRRRRQPVAIIGVLFSLYPVFVLTFYAVLNTKPRLTL